jgi:hypothetical protein
MHIFVSTLLLSKLTTMLTVFGSALDVREDIVYEIGSDDSLAP